jgi:hypothetical protein
MFFRNSQHSQLLQPDRPVQPNQLCNLIILANYSTSRWSTQPAHPTIPTNQTANKSTSWVFREEIKIPGSGVFINQVQATLGWK